MSPGQAKVKTTLIICKQQCVSLQEMNQTAINITDRTNDHDFFLRLSIEINLLSVRSFNLKVFSSKLSEGLKGGGMSVYG